MRNGLQTNRQTLPVHKMNTETITTEQVKDFLANDQMGEVIELIKDIANGSYSADALKEDILESLES